MNHEAHLSMNIMNSSMNVCLLCIIMCNSHMDVMNEREMVA
jgi:hypothetical protein